jgi:hypothetical protein
LEQQVLQAYKELLGQLEPPVLLEQQVPLAYKVLLGLVQPVQPVHGAMNILQHQPVVWLSAPEHNRLQLKLDWLGVLVSQ